MLVTGHVGFLGQHITRSLSSDGVAWRGLDRQPRDCEHHVLADVRDICRIEIDPAEVSEIIHLASPVGVPTTSYRDDSVFTEIVSATTALASFASRANARVLFVSSSEVYGETPHVIDGRTEARPLSGYARGKLEGEKILFGSLPEVFVIRPSNVYGPGQRSEFVVPHIIDCILADKPVPIVNGGRTVRQFTYVTDFVEAVMRVRAGWTWLTERVLNVAGPEAVQIRDLATAVGDILCRPVFFANVKPEWLGRNPATEVSFRRVNGASIDGWRPRIAVKEGLALTVAARVAHREQ